jgi:hypothetical protein
MLPFPLNRLRIYNSYIEEWGTMHTRMLELNLCVYSDYLPCTLLQF